MLGRNSEVRPNFVQGTRFIHSLLNKICESEAMSSTTIYSLDQVSSHNTKSDIWIILHNKVYDITKYLDDHPGGAPVLVEIAGTDATEAFEEIGHSDEARELLEPYLLGKLATQEMAEEVEIYRPTYEQVSQTAAVEVRKKKSAFSLILKSLFKALPLGLVSGLGYVFYTAKPNLLRHAYEGTIRLISSDFHTASGSYNSSFWYGVGITSVAQVGLTSALTFWISTKLDVQESFASFKPYRSCQSATLVPKPSVPPGRFLSVATAGPKPLDPQKWRKFKLIRKDRIAPNVYLITFSLPRPDDALGLPTGQHIALRATINGQSVSRSYTPISNNTDLGRLELLIKVYDQGLMTKHLEAMKLGDEIEIRGPKGAMQFKSDFASHIGMIAGGTGITPMYQVIRASLDDPTDHTVITLLYANNTEEDVLLRKELDNYATRFPHRFQVKYILSRPLSTWNGPKGFVTAELIKTSFPSAAPDTKVFLCGPPPMIDAMKNNLVGLGYKQPGLTSKATDQVFLF